MCISKDGRSPGSAQTGTRATRTSDNLTERQWYSLGQGSRCERALHIAKLQDVDNPWLGVDVGSATSLEWCSRCDWLALQIWRAPVEKGYNFKAL